MSELSPLQLREIDRCYVYVCDNIRIDNIPFRSVLFGTTVENWFRALLGESVGSKIAITGTPPNGTYKRVTLGVDND